MRFFYVEPEVAGGLGTRTLMDRSVHPPVVTRLHYELSGWLGDAIIESFPCFVVTNEARQLLQSSRVGGVEFNDVEISASAQFQELHPQRQLPEFVWMRVHGEAGRDDCGIASDARLVVSERVLEILSSLGVSHAVISEFIR